MDSRKLTASAASCAVNAWTSPSGISFEAGRGNLRGNVGLLKDKALSRGDLKSNGARFIFNDEAYLRSAAFSE